MHVTVPSRLKERAIENGLNMSAIARKAIREACERLESKGTPESLQA